MNLLEVNKIVEGRYDDDTATGTPAVAITQDDLYNFNLLLDIDRKYREEGLYLTNSHTEFYNAFELFDAVVEDELKEELFYAAKLGFFIKGVPSRLVYLLQLAIRKYTYPNYALAAIDRRVLAKYLKRGVLADGITIKDVIENLLGKSYQPLTEYTRAACYDDVAEVFVENTDRVMLVRKEFFEYFSNREDAKTVTYVKDEGVKVQDKLVRTLGNQLGITADEYDLRECM